MNGSALYQAEKVGEQSVSYGLAAGARAFRRISTPLQRELNLVIRVMLLFALFFELLLLLGALASQLPTVETLKMAVVIIGLVPNGLFLSISVAYALGAVRIAGQGALVQQANSVESLSNVDVLCMDKTGTLTTNALQLERADPLGIEESELRRLLGDYIASGSVGNTTSAAIGAACPGQARHVREELPFSSAYKWSGLVMDDEAVRGTYILGAVEILAPALRAGSDLQAMVEQESDQGLRVLLFTSVPELISLRNANDKPTLPHGLIPLGLISLSDELRPQARETLRQLSEAGIRFKVISGDNPQTVAALVKQAGLSSDIRAVSGLDLATMDAAHFATTAADATVFGRITPQQKEQLVDVLHKQGHKSGPGHRYAEWQPGNAQRSGYRAAQRLLCQLALCIARGATHSQRHARHLKTVPDACLLLRRTAEWSLGGGRISFRAEAGVDPGPAHRRYPNLFAGGVGAPGCPGEKFAAFALALRPTSGEHARPGRAPPIL